jgi:hypothetical protein
MSIAMLMLLGLVPNGACLGLNGDQCAAALNLSPEVCSLAVPADPSEDPDYCAGVACTEETDACCDETVGAL